MYEKDWTPKQVGRLTFNDLRILTREKAPVDPGLGGSGRIGKAEGLLAIKARLDRERETEEGAWRMADG